MIANKIYIPKWDGYRIPTVQYFPDDYISNSTEKFPLIIFLHGNGEIGDGSDGSLDRLLNSRNHDGILTAADRYRSIVVAPQFVPQYNEWRPEWSGGTYVDTVIEWALSNLPVDGSRIYLTGLSGGGGGCWDYISLLKSFNQKIAAVAPICGTEQSGLRDWSLVAQTSLPLWAFHAQDDLRISVGATIRQVNLVNSFMDAYENSIPARMTIYTSGGHGIWGRVYNNLENDDSFYEWLFSHKRTESPVPWEPNRRIKWKDGSVDEVYIENI